MNETNINLNENSNELRLFFIGIYKWMVTGLALSGIVAYLVLNTSYFNFILENRSLFFGLIGIQLILVLGIQFIIGRIKPSTAGILFFIYAALMGLLSAVLFNIFALSSIISIFVVAVLIYGILAVMGFNTKKDISGWYPFLFTGMVGVIVVSLINFFTQSTMVDFIVSIIAVLVFAGFTVYDHQAYKNIYNDVKNQGEEVERYTILGALHMYINFVAIFQNLLSLFGERD